MNIKYYNYHNKSDNNECDVLVFNKMCATPFFFHNLRHKAKAFCFNHCSRQFTLMMSNCEVNEFFILGPWDEVCVNWDRTKRIYTNYRDHLTKPYGYSVNYLDSSSIEEMLGKIVAKNISTQFEILRFHQRLKLYPCDIIIISH